MILAKLLLKRLALVFSEAQTCPIPYLRLMQYIIEKSETTDGFVGALVYLDESKTFDSIDHHYLEAVLKTGGLGHVFRG